jgi:hypothetical protein
MGKRDGSGSRRKNGWANERAIIQIPELSIIHFKEVRIICWVEKIDKEITCNSSICRFIFSNIQHAASVAVGLKSIQC